ncbi:MAG: hypothetical protein HQ542_12280 [Bacteroidia bacterium]|nr:hypothetical protein [Bacteroidia bacterium]
MTWYEWIALIAVGVSLGVSIFHVFRLVRLGNPHDNAPAAGRVGPAVLYAMTGAMNPAKKESAYLHLPTYVAGIFYHLGTFLSMLLFLLIWIHLPFSPLLIIILSCFLVVSAACGVGILVKRASNKELRALSNPDDYLSNILVTLFQIGTLLTLSLPEVEPVYFILSSILFLYIPLSKLKHVIYFFAARYHLGFFYGWRGVWPPGKGV